MDFRGTVVSIRSFPTGNPSVEVKAFHDPTMLTWAEWQTDLNGGEPKLGLNVRVSTFGPLKIATRK